MFIFCPPFVDSQKYESSLTVLSNANPVVVLIHLQYVCFRYFLCSLLFLSPVLVHFGSDTWFYPSSSLWFNLFSVFYEMILFVILWGFSVAFASKVKWKCCIFSESWIIFYATTPKLITLTWMDICRCIMRLSKETRNHWRRSVHSQYLAVHSLGNAGLSACLPLRCYSLASDAVYFECCDKFACKLTSRLGWFMIGATIWFSK